MRPEIDEKCQGYYGFGTGYIIAQNPPKAGQPGYCDRCPFREECWKSHRARVQAMLPDAAALVDKLCAELGGPAGIKEFMRITAEAGAPPAEPYISVMMGNIEDGAFVSTGGKPKDRGPYTLPYPFTKGN